MHRLLYPIVAILTLCITASAQQRVPNQGKQVVLRTWPATGVWQVVLVRLVDGGLGCLLTTGHADPKSGERYIWGIRWRIENVAAMITDNNQQAVAGPSIQIIVDTIPIGIYPISRRVSGGAGFYNVTAEFPPPDTDRVLNLVRAGGQIQFVTNSSTYSASLQGARDGVRNLEACILEENHLIGPDPTMSKPAQSMD